MKRVLALTMLLAVAAVTMGADPGRFIDQTEADEYLAPRYYQPKAGVCLTFDDGYPSFWSQFVRMSDSIYVATGGNVRIRGTVSTITSDMGGGARAGWSELASRGSDQTDFEIAYHGNSDERFGSSQAGFSRTWVDSMLGNWRAAFKAHGLPEPRTLILPNHRYTPGLEEIFIKHGIYQVGGLAIPVSSDSAGSYTANEHSLMEVNNDPYPLAMTNRSNTAFACFQRHGGIQNRWNIGRRTSFSNAAATADTLKAIINIAVQSRTMAVLTLHDIGDTTGSDLTILPSDLAELMGHIATLMNADLLESLTFEQMTARGCGRVYGELLPHHNFTRLQDVLDSADVRLGDGLEEAFKTPIGWWTHGSQSFYPGTGDTLTASFAAADSTFWKVWPLSGRTVVDSLNGLAADLDTVAAIYADSSLTDYLSYGMSSPTGRVFVSASPTGDDTYGLPICAIVTGVTAPYVDVTVQAMVDNAVSVNAYLGCRFAQYQEQFNDFINDDPLAYDFTAGTTRLNGWAPGNLEPQRTRVRPMFWMATIDTAYGRADTTYTLGAGEMHRYAYEKAMPYFLDTQSVVDWHAPFGNTADLAAVGSAKKAIFKKLQFFDGAYDTTRLGTSHVPDGGYGNVYWLTYNYRIPIVPGQTDFVYGWVYLKRSTGFTGNPTMLVSDVSVTAGRM